VNQSVGAQTPRSPRKHEIQFQVHIYLRTVNLYDLHCERKVLIGTAGESETILGCWQTPIGITKSLRGKWNV
jgi:hypothetical protein